MWTFGIFNNETYIHDDTKVQVLIKSTGAGWIKYREIYAVTGSMYIEMEIQNETVTLDFFRNNYTRLDVYKKLEGKEYTKRFKKIIFE